MKKSISLFFALVLFGLNCFVVIAESPVMEDPVSVSYTYFSDGSYLITEIFVQKADSQKAVKGFYNEITETKVNTYYQNNTLAWKVSLTATFAYNGTAASCKSASVSHTIYNSSWSVYSESASKSNNTATGQFTLRRYSAGIPIQEINRTITMTCSGTGVVS